MSVVANNTNRLVVEEGGKGAIFDILGDGALAIYVREEQSSPSGGTDTVGRFINLNRYDTRRVQQWMADRLAEGAPEWEVKHTSDGPQLYVDGVLTATAPYHQHLGSVDFREPFPARMAPADIGAAVSTLIASGRAPKP